MDPNQPREAVLERRIAKISRLLEADCPAFLVNAAADLAFKWSAPASGEGGA